MELNRPSTMLTNLPRDSFLHLVQLFELFSSQMDKEMVQVLFYLIMFHPKGFTGNFAIHYCYGTQSLNGNTGNFADGRYVTTSCHVMTLLVVTPTINTCQIVNGLSTELQAKEQSSTSLNLTWNRTTII